MKLCLTVGIKLTAAARKKYWLRPKVSEHAAGCGTPAGGSAAAVDLSDQMVYYYNSVVDNCAGKILYYIL